MSDVEALVLNSGNSPRLELPRLRLVDALDELKKNEGFHNIVDRPTLYIVSFTLPVEVVVTQQKVSVICSVEGSVISELYNVRHQCRLSIKFVGWPQIVCKDLAEEVELRTLLEEHDCLPVFLPRALLEKYLRFMSNFLIPLFHGIFVLASDEVFKIAMEGWNDYQDVNRAFARVLAAEAYQTDTIWTHDLHLLLLAQFLARRIHCVNLGLFLHCPFPSYEMFRCLPVREEILRAMLFADLIGFNFAADARNFLMSVQHLLGIDYSLKFGGFIELHIDGRIVLLKIAHAYIDYVARETFLRTDSQVQSQARTIRDTYKDTFIIASIDPCLRTSGLKSKIRCLQHFQKTYPESRPVTLIQVLIADIFATEKDKQLETDFLALQRSPEDSKLGKLRVVIQHGPLQKHEKYALFQASDAYWNASISSTFNLDAFSYICCKDGCAAPLVISEGVKIGDVLASAIRFNPFQIPKLAETLHRLVNSPQTGLRDRFDRDVVYIRRSTTVAWAEDICADILKARKKDHLQYISWGFGTSYRVLGMDTHFQKLEIDPVVMAYRHAKRRVFFLDHEGTLAQDRRMITAVPGMELLTALGSAPSAEVKKCLKALCEAGDTVVILSGRDRSLLTSWFDDISDNLCLCAEHGFEYKIPPLYGEYWKTTNTTTDFTWKVIASQLMNQYVKRTQGAFIENKGSALVFQYRDADYSFGQWQSKELFNHLKELLVGYAVIVVAGKGHVEVRLRGVSKGVAVQTFLRELNDQDEVDFILCIGDDRSDEEMFPVVNSFYEQPLSQRNSFACSRQSLESELSQSNATPIPSSDFWNKAADIWSKQHRQSVDGLFKKTSHDSFQLPSKAAFTVTVGKKPSEAKYYLNDVDEVLSLLQRLTFPRNKGFFTDQFPTPC